MEGEGAIEGGWWWGEGGECVGITEAGNCAWSSVGAVAEGGAVWGGGGDGGGGAVHQVHGVRCGVVGCGLALKREGGGLRCGVLCGAGLGSIILLKSLLY